MDKKKRLYSISRKVEAAYKRLCELHPDRLEMLGYHEPLHNQSYFKFLPSSNFTTIVKIEEEKEYLYGTIWILDYLIDIHRLRELNQLSQQEYKYLRHLLLEGNSEKDLPLGVALIEAPEMQKKFSLNGVI